MKKHQPEMDQQPEEKAEKVLRTGNKKTTIGGQALIEGLMMIGQRKRPWPSASRMEQSCWK